VTRKTLQRRAQRISPAAVVAQRLKRLSSIGLKLQKNAWRFMTLTQIQDIGCRAIMPTISDKL